MNSTSAQHPGYTMTLSLNSYANWLLAGSPTPGIWHKKPLERDVKRSASRPFEEPSPDKCAE